MIIYEAYKYIDTNEYLYREDEGIYSNLGENYKDYYVLEYDTFYALIKKEIPKMISIAEMKELAQKELETEKLAEKAKYNKDLATYRARLKEVKPELMKYIEKRIYNGIKNNSKIGLYESHVEDIFNPINKHGDNVLIYLADTTLKPYDAYNTALKELADVVRQELFDAGVKRIINNPRNCFMGEPHLFLEV